MTTANMSEPTLANLILYKASQLANKRTTKRSSIRVNAVLNAFVRLMLHLGGFALLTWAGFEWNMIAGLVIAGISCFVMSTLMTGGNDDAPVTQDRR